MYAQRNLDIQFHRARALAWAAVGLRMLKDSSAYSHYLESALVLVGAITTMIPAWAHSWFEEKRYVEWRSAVLFFDNILQVGLGCLTHAHIYPETTATSWKEASSWRALAVVVTGSGVSWLNMSGLLGCLVFRFALAQQAALTIMMLLASPAMCARSYSLQRGYLAIHEFLSQCLNALALTSTNRTSSGGLSQSMVDGDSAEKICLTYQHVVLLLCGMILPTLYIFLREIRSRLIFVNNLRHDMNGIHVITMNPPPSMSNYWTFALPAAAAVYVYVARGLQ